MVPSLLWGQHPNKILKKSLITELNSNVLVYRDFEYVDDAIIRLHLIYDHSKR
jgi:hypothetical protein